MEVSFLRSVRRSPLFRKWKWLKTFQFCDPKKHQLVLVPRGFGSKRVSAPAALRSRRSSIRPTPSTAPSPIARSGGAWRGSCATAPRGPKWCLGFETPSMKTTPWCALGCFFGGSVCALCSPKIGVAVWIR